jgi:inner membrane protein
MEPVTHFLTGAVLSRAGFNRKTALATLTMTLAAEAPDLDAVAYMHGSAQGFIEHRGITHTFLGVPFVAALVVAVIWLGDTAWQRIRRKRGKPPAAGRRWGVLYGLACIAGLSHLLLDFTNNYGLRPFYPFSAVWHAWDIVFIIEPVMLVVLAGALVLPSLFGLVKREIGVREKGTRGQAAAIAALALVVLLWGVRDVEHRRALAAIDAVEFHGEPAIRVAAFPYPGNPFRWAGVAEVSNGYVSTVVDSLRGVADPESRAETYFKPVPTAASEAAQRTPLGSFYLGWARFPLVETERLTAPAGGYLVHFTDVRFLYPESGRTPLQAFVRLDSGLRLEAEGMKTLRQQR